MSMRLFIGNLSYTATEEDVREAFSENGFELRSVSIPTDRETGQARGFGFVEVNSAEEAQKAIETMEGAVIAGRPIRVNEAHERERRPAQNHHRGGKERRGGGRGRQRDNDRW